jgi:hypothetical protein
MSTNLGLGLGLAALVPVALIGVIVLAIVALAGGREPDPTGTRQRAVYLGLVSFVSLFVMAIAVVAVAGSLAGLIGHQGEVMSGSISGEVSSDPGSSPTFTSESSLDTSGKTDRAVTGAVEGASVFVAALGVFAFHRRRLGAIIDSPGFAASPARRAVAAFMYAVCFVAAIAALVGVAIGLQALFRVAAPGVTAPDFGDERAEGARQLLIGAVVAVVGVTLFLWHWRKPEEWDAQAPPPVEPPPVEPPPVEPPPPAARVRKAVKKAPDAPIA